MSDSLSGEEGKALQVKDGGTPLDASVDFINTEVFSYVSKEGQANAYQAVSQSMAQAIQDARMGLQNMVILTGAVETLVMKKIAECVAAGDDAGAAQWTTFAATLSGPTGPLYAQNTFLGAVGDTTTAILKEFPNGS
jgi:hypothetical protein